MMRCKSTLVGAVLAGGMLAASASATDQNRNSIMDAGDSGIATPSAAPNQSVPAPRARGGEPTIPRSGVPASPNESNPQLMREYQAPLLRSNNPNLPNPVTPSAANESAPQPRTTLSDPTNQTGMGREPVGATR